jgi:hypothetical protein
MTVLKVAVPLEAVGCSPRRALLGSDEAEPSPLPLACTPVYTPYISQSKGQQVMKDQPYSSIASPELDISIGDRFASRCVDYVDVQVRDGTSLCIENIRANQLTGDPFSSLV